LKKIKKRSESFNLPSDRVYQLIDLIDCIQTSLHEYTHWYELAGTNTGILISQLSWKERIDVIRVVQGSFANCNISLGLDLFNKGITEYI